MLKIKFTAILFLILLSSGCSNNNVSTDKLKAIDYISNDPALFLFNTYWLDDNMLLCYSCFTPESPSPKSRLVKYDLKTDKQTLIYEGENVAGYAPSGFVRGKDNLIYMYDGLGCLVFNDYLETIEYIKYPVEIGSMKPSINGDFVFRTLRPNGNVAVAEKTRFDEIDNLKQEYTNTDSKQVLFESPKWSSDGEHIAYAQIIEDTYNINKVGILSRDGNKDIMLDIEGIFDFRWGNNPDQLIVTKSSENPEQIDTVQIYDLIEKQVINSFNLEEVKGKKIEVLEIMDSYNSKILLRVYFENDSTRIPLISYDQEKKTAELLTDIDDWVLNANFSPDGSKVAIIRSDDPKPLLIYEF